MALTAYTSYADVRAALGVSQKDLSDETLGLPYYEDSLVEGLDSVHSSLIPAFDESTATDPQTPAQSRLTRSFRVLATLITARAAIPALRMAAPQQVTDGKAAFTRFNDPLAELSRALDEKYNQARVRAEEALAQLTTSNSSTVPRVWFSAVTPGSDPVTGE